MHGRLLALSALALLTVPSLSMVSAPSEANRFFTDATLLEASSVDTGAHAGALIANGSGETTILLDKSGTWIWTGSFGGVHRSSDGGATWATNRPQQLPGAFADGWAIAQDDAGNLYAADTQGQFIAVSMSTNGGATWTLRNYVSTGASVIADRPWLAARGDGIVALVTNDFPAGESCHLSTDHGLTWVSGVSVGGRANAANLLFDAAGKLYYGAGNNAYMWANACTQVPTPRVVSFGASGAQIFQTIAVAGSGTNGGDIYTALPSTNNGAMTLRASHGMNGFSVKSLTVSDASMRSNTFGSVAVKPDNSEVAVAWYGSSTAGNPASSGFPASATWNVYVARVTGFWTATPAVTVTTVDTNVYSGYFCMSGVTCSNANRRMSDYYDVDYGSDGDLHVVWGIVSGTGTANSKVHYQNLG